MPPGVQPSSIPDRTAIEKQWRVFDVVLSNTPDFAYTFDLQGRFTYINRALLALWGKSFDEAIGKNFFELDYPPALAARLQRQIQEVIATRKPLRDQTPFTDPSGGTGHYEYIFVPVFSASGEVEAVAGSTREITERINAENRLRESERKFLQLANAMPQIVWTADPSGALDYVNEQLTAFSGLPTEAALGAGWLAVVHPDDRDKAVERWSHSLSTGEVYETEFRLRAASGQWCAHLVRAHPTRNETGRIVRWYGTCTDIQNQKDTALELERSNAELAVFAHVAAHDLHAPLRMVRSYTQLLERNLAGRLDRDSQEILQTVLDGAERMEQLIRGLLNYAQVGHGEPDRVTVSMDSATAEALKNLEPLIHVSHAEVEYADLPPVQGDRILLVELLQNLLANAIKYACPEAPPRVRVSAQVIGGECVFAVQDNGQGVAPEYHARIFEPLQRLHGGAVPGTGIGLTVCRRIVERHGGRIWLESQAGQGATFYFTLAAPSHSSLS